MASGALAYPASDELDPSFFAGVEVPTSPKVKNTDDPESPDFEQPQDHGQPSSFAEIFKKTRGHILEAWSVLSEDMFESDTALGARHRTVFGDWSLDTGIDHASKRLRLWPWDAKLIKP
jgi:hypothetical protein